MYGGHKKWFYPWETTYKGPGISPYHTHTLTNPLYFNMPQFVSTDTWFPIDHVRPNPNAGSVESILPLSHPYHLDMIMAQLIWAGNSVDYLIALSNTFDAAVFDSPVTVRQAIINHWLKAVVVAVATTEDYLTLIAIGIERLQSSINVLISSDEVLAHRSQLGRYRQLKGILWTGFQTALKPLAFKVDHVSLDEIFLLFNPEFTPNNAFKPGTILGLVGLSAEHKQSFFLEVVELWGQVQTSWCEIEEIPRLVKAASRLFRVTDDFWKTGSYQPESEAATTDTQTQASTTEFGYGLEDRENDAADGAEIDVEPQSPSTVIGDQEAHSVQPESPDTLVGDYDGHAFFAQETDAAERQN